MFVEHKEAVEITEKPAKVWKLSEAIRTGSKYRPQCVGVFFNEQTGRSCAMGAAMEAMYGLGVLLSLSPKLWMETCERFPNHVIHEVFHRNDGGQSRESIADWLESQGY